MPSPTCRQAFDGSMLDLVRAGPEALERLRAALADAPRRPLAAVRLELPIRPGKVLCSGINYRAHAEENPNAKMPEEPFFFAKLPNAVVGPDVPVAARGERTSADGLRGRVRGGDRPAAGAGGAGGR